MIFSIRIIVLFLFLNLFVTCSYADSYRAIVVSSYHAEFEARRGMIGELTKRLLDEVQVKMLYIDSKRNSAFNIAKRANKISKTIDTLTPDIIFLCDDASLKFLGEKLILQGYNVVFLGVNDNPRSYVKDEQFQQLYGVLERPLYLRGILELRFFYPTIETVTLLIDDTLTSNIILDDIFKGANSIQLGELTVNFKKITTFQMLVDFIDLINKDENNQLFLISLHNLTQDNSGKVLSSFQAESYLAKNYKKPLFSFWREKVKQHKVLASYGISEKTQGQIAADIGNKLLLNNVIRKNILTPDKGILFISKKRLDEFSIILPEKLFETKTVLIK